MIEHKFPYESFIGGWYIPEKICDNIVNYFNVQKSKGLVGKGEVVGGKNVNINTNVKDCEDLSISPKNFDYPFFDYRKYLQNCLEEYIKRYNKIYFLDHFNVNTSYNLQFYKKGGGFKVYHCERSGVDFTLKRCLVFMTYLNDVPNGGTEWMYQNYKSEAKKGLTVLWPSDFTHTHRGIISSTHEKYIITGWFIFKN